MHPLTVLKQWFTVLFKTLSLASLIVNLWTSHWGKDIEDVSCCSLLDCCFFLLFCVLLWAPSWMQVVLKVRHLLCSLFCCLEGDLRCDWNYLSVYEFLFPSQTLLEKASGISHECNSHYFYHKVSAVNRIIWHAPLKTNISALFCFLRRWCVVWSWYAIFWKAGEQGKSLGLWFPTGLSCSSSSWPLLWTSPTRSLCAAVGACCILEWSVCYMHSRGLLFCFHCFCNLMHWQGAKVST